MLDEGQIIRLEGSPDRWVVVAVERDGITVCHEQMEAYQIDVTEEDILEVVEE